MAAATDLFKQLTNNFSTTLTGAIIGAGDTSMSLGSTTNLPTLTGTVFVIDRVNASGTATPTLREYVKGTVTGLNIQNLVRGLGNSTAQAHLSGAVVEQVVDQNTINDIVTGILNHSDQTGALLPSAVQTALGTGNLSNTGYNALGYTPNTVTNNGNNSYTCTFNTVDLTGVLSPGMRLRTTRTVLPSTRSMGFVTASSQYATIASPANYTFTAAFTYEAWVYLNSYTNAGIITRDNAGSAGSGLDINTNGTLLGFYRDGTNTSTRTSYQSLPLKKWTHIAYTQVLGSSQLLYINGVSVPLVSSGTATTLSQGTGPLQIGAVNSVSPFDGYIADARVWSVAQTQAAIQANMTQTMTTATNLVANFPGNGTFNDVSGNANNLTAAGGAVATNLDVPYSNRVAPSVTSGYDFGIVQAVSFATNTTVVVQTAEGNSIPTSGGVSAVVYSSQKVPFGFPASSDKWRIENIFSSRGVQSNPVTATTYNFLGRQVTYPQGSWNAGYDTIVYVNCSATGTVDGRVDLNTGQAVYSTASPFAQAAIYVTSATEAAAAVTKRVPISLSAPTTYYLNFRFTSNATGLNIADLADFSPVKIFAENAYL